MSNPFEYAFAFIPPREFEDFGEKNFFVIEGIMGDKLVPFGIHNNEFKGVVACVEPVSAFFIGRVFFEVANLNGVIVRLVTAKELSETTRELMEDDPRSGFPVPRPGEEGTDTPLYFSEDAWRPHLPL